MALINRIEEKYYEFYNHKQLEEFDDSLIFVLFKSDFILTGTKSFSMLPRVARYWPKEGQEKLYNPITKRVASAVVLSKEKALKILTSKSFDYHRVEYHILFRCFVITQEELNDFNPQPIIKNIEKKKQEKVTHDKIKTISIEQIINTNKIVINNLCDFSWILCNHLMEKVIYQNKLAKNGFKKLFTNAQISFIQNIMWIFLNQIVDLKAKELPFLNKTIFKYIYNHRLLDYATEYIKTGSIDIKDDFLNSPFYNYHFNLFTKVISNKYINEKLLACYKTNRLILSKTQAQWKTYGWDKEHLEKDDNSLPPNNKNITYNGKYLDQILYSQIKLIAYQMNEIILSSSKTLYN